MGTDTHGDRPTVDEVACRLMLSEFKKIQRRQRRLTRGADGSKRISLFFGVHKAGRSSWSAWFYHEGQNRYLGSFPTEEEAARARDAEAIRRKGAAARLNFPSVPFEAKAEAEAEGGAA